MLSFVKIVKHVMSKSGHSPVLFYRGVIFRFLEQLCAIAPLFIGFFWLLPYIHKNEHTSFDMSFFSSQEKLLISGAALFLLLIGQFYFSHRGRMDNAPSGYEFMRGYRQKLINHVHSLPLGYIQHNRVGSLANILSEDVAKIEMAMTHLAADLLSSFLVPLFFSFVLFWVDWRLVAALLLPLPFSVAVLVSSKRFFMREGQYKQALLKKTSGILVEFVLGIVTFRLFNQTNSRLRKLHGLFGEIRKTSMALEGWAAGPVQLCRLVLEGSLVILLITASYLASIQSLNPALWLLFVLVAYRLLSPLLEASAYMVQLQLITQSDARLRSIFDERALDEPEISIEPQSYDIQFENVSFSYGSQNEKALENISLRIPAGKTTAIVGPSGSGKTTLLTLIARFFDPEQGGVKMGGVDLKDMGSALINTKLSYVFQDVQLYNDTILENVRLGKRNANDQDCIEACKNACCDHFIQQLSHGYETVIGENGCHLSGGERQRLSIARALLKDAPVLLLDEITAAVDVKTQRDIQSALACLKKDKTVITVAHRLSTIKNADLIIVMDKGNVVEQGRHDDLLGKHGKYAEMVKCFGYDGVEEKTMQ